MPEADANAAKQKLAFFLAILNAGRIIDGDEPIRDDAVMLHYSGHGGSAIVTWADLVAIANEASPDGDQGGW